MFPWEKETHLEGKQRESASSRERVGRWLTRHRDENKEKCRKFNAENPDYLQQWRAENPDKVKEYSLRQNDTEERKAYMREYMREYRKTKKEAEKSAESADKGDANSDNA